MGLTRPIPFFSVNPACSLWFPIASHAGKDRTNLSFLKDNRKNYPRNLLHNIEVVLDWWRVHYCLL